jgi:hypothetical protein
LQLSTFADIIDQVIFDTRQRQQCSCACFSGETHVQVLGKAVTKMKDLQIGDKIYTGDHHGYEPVYGFGHYDKDKVVEFLEIHTQNGDNPNSFLDPAIQVTRDHLVYANGKYTAAKNIRVGDTLLGDDGQQRTIQSIHHVIGRGLYAPLTPSGTLVANRIHVSAYISMQKNLPYVLEHQWSKLLPEGLTMSQHAFVHMLASPVRIICIGGIYSTLCSNDSVNPEMGLPGYVQFALLLVDAWDQGHWATQTVLLFLFVTICGTAFAMELLVGAQHVPTLWMIVAACVGVCIWTKHRQGLLPPSYVAKSESI